MENGRGEKGKGKRVDTPEQLSSQPMSPGYMPLYKIPVTVSNL